MAVSAEDVGGPRACTLSSAASTAVAPIPDLEHGSEAGFSVVPSIPSSAGALARKQKAVKFEGPSTVRVKLAIRFVAGGGGFLVSSLSLKREAVAIPELKNKRRKFDTKEKEKIVAIVCERGLSEAARRANNTALQALTLSLARRSAGGGRCWRAVARTRSRAGRGRATSSTRRC